MQQHMLLGYSYDVKRISLKSGCELTYMDVGAGNSTIVFIHGLANYAPIWNAQLAHLKDKYRCIAIDLPGNGLSTYIDTQYTMEFYAESVIDCIEQLNLNRVVLCGHSMGGLVAMTIALQAPQLVEKLILMAPAGIEYFAPLEVLWMKQLLTLGNFIYSDEQHLENAINQSFFRPSASAPNIIYDLKKIMNQQSLKKWRNMCVDSIISMLDHQLNGKLAQIAHPALILFGKEDALIPNRVIHPFATIQAMAARAKVLLPQSNVGIIDNAGHFVQIEQAAAVNDLMTKILMI